MWLGFLILLLFLDVFVPPAELPSVVDRRHDSIGESSFLSWVWSLSTSEQILLSSMATLLLRCVIAFPSRVFLGNISHARDFEWKVIGVVVGLSGWGLRLWAKYTLAASFTYQVSIPPSLVTSGPYSLLVHPGYSGVILHICGILILATRPFDRFGRLALVALLNGIAIAALRVRILDEETVMSSHFGVAWTMHTASRWRLMPFVW